jgi:hypothetical protein
VHGLGARALDDVEDPVDLQVGLGGRPGPEQVGLRGPPDVEGVAVGLGVDRDGGHAELVERADDADGDLAAVAYEDLLEHAAQDGTRRLPARAHG